MQNIQFSRLLIYLNKVSKFILKIISVAIRSFISEAIGIFHEIIFIKIAKK